MADLIVDALRRSLSRGEFSPLAGQYDHRCVLESYVDGRREALVGESAVSLRWLEIIRGCGPEMHFSVQIVPGGFEIDVQRLTSYRVRPVRQFHLLHVADRKILRHLVYPAQPVEPHTLPRASLPGVVTESVAEFRSQGFSGAALFRARLDSGEPVVVKYVRPAGDWLARASRDPGREGLLYAEGVYGELPVEISSPVISAAVVDDGWLIVMRDVGEALEAVHLGDQAANNETLLTAAQAMHAKFSGPRPSDSLCTLEDRLRLFSPLRPLVERHGEDTLPKTLATSWECFADESERAVSDAVLRLVVDPSELVAALRDEAPFTLLHGDFRLANLGIDSGAAAVVVLDWGLACYGPAELDFVWFVSNTAWAGDAARTHLESVWARLTGHEPDSRVMDLAVIYHAVMGEVAFVLSQARYQPPGFTKPSQETVAWWLRRLERAFNRVGDMAAADQQGYGLRSIR